MKIHRRILTHYLSCTSPVDKEGYLYKKRERSASYLRRWFVLKGNLLFYQSRPGDRGLLGVIVLEGCVVLSGQSDFSFSLVFTGPGLRTYRLAADDQRNQKSWVNALLSASHAHISLLVRDLARLYQEAKEREAPSDSSPDSSVNASSSVMASFYTAAPYFTQPHPSYREFRSYSDSHVLYPSSVTPLPIRAALRRQPKHWKKRNAHVTPMNGPATHAGEWSDVDVKPQDEFIKLHERYGKEVKQLRDDWLKKKREEAGHVEDLIDLS